MSFWTTTIAGSVSTLLLLRVGGKRPPSEIQGGEKSQGEEELSGE